MRALSFQRIHSPLSLPPQVLGRQRNQQRVHTMTVEDGHVVDVDGGGGGGATNGNNNAAAGSDKGTKYAQSSADHATVTSGVGRNSLFAPQPDDDNANQVARGIGGMQRNREKSSKCEYCLPQKGWYKVA